MEVNTLAAEFVTFCLTRRAATWPEIYDEMCWVAGRRLFHGLSYEDLSREGVFLDLTHLAQLRHLVEQISRSG